jgi:hypothetical protein
VTWTFVRLDGIGAQLEPYISCKKCARCIACWLLDGRLAIRLKPDEGPSYNLHFKVRMHAHLIQLDCSPTSALLMTLANATGARHQIGHDSHYEIRSTLPKLSHVAIHVGGIPT